MGQCNCSKRRSAAHRWIRSYILGRRESRSPLLHHGRRDRIRRNGIAERVLQVLHHASTFRRGRHDSKLTTGDVRWRRDHGRSARLRAARLTGQRQNGGGMPASDCTGTASGSVPARDSRASSSTPASSAPASVATGAPASGAATSPGAVPSRNSSSTESVWPGIGEKPGRRIDRHHGDAARDVENRCSGDPRGRLS